MPDAESPTVLVVGAGLAGLVAAAELHAAGVSVRVWEARDRLGGRCWSVPVGPDAVRLDLGAAWHWDEHERVTALAERLGVERVRQHEPGIAVRETAHDAPVEQFEWPETPPPSWRFVGGAQALHEALAAVLPDAAIRLNHRLTVLHRTDTGMRAAAHIPDGERTVDVEAVVLAVPPRLALYTVRFRPPPPPSVLDAMRAMPTWMSHAGKAAVTYDRPFWRERGLAGRVESEVGPVHDWHDAVTPDGHAALVGFLHPPGPDSSTPIDSDEREDALVRQLVHCFGQEAATPSGIATCDWTQEAATTPPFGSVSDPDAPPDPAPALQEPLWNGRLHLAAAETAVDYPGYLDGAIEAGRRAAAALT
jgi:monoamine oxidase